MEAFELFNILNIWQVWGNVPQPVMLSWTMSSNVQTALVGYISLLSLVSWERWRLDAVTKG